jgi:tetratricopeptide (TPR) repeat protein
VPSLELSEPRRVAEQTLGRPLSAAEVSRFWLDKGLSWVRAEPVAFLRLQLRKLGLFWGWYEWPDAVDYYWLKTRSPVLHLPLLEFGGVSGLAFVGLVLERRRLRPWLPVLFVAAGWCLSTVIFIILARYRVPVAPALLPLAAATLVEAAAAMRAGPRPRGVVLALLCGAFWVAPHLAGFEPLTPLVEYNLGRLAAQRGKLPEAEEHFRLALEADPNSFLAALDLGSLAAGRGDIAAARGWFERAVAIEPTFDEARANLGGALLASGDMAGAGRELGEALALNPTNLTALHNSTVLELKLGRVDRARDLNRRVLELEPNHVPARSLQRKIERLSQETRGGGD